MTSLPFVQIDAFAEKPFEGNQACVIPLDAWLDDATLQAIGNENNVAETAFIVRDESGEADYELRWFTPAVEVAMCGHATLASGAYVLERAPQLDRVRFRTRKAGVLIVARDSDRLALDLPAGTYTVAITAADAADDSAPAIGPVDLTLEASTSYTAVAHLDASGDPTATLFTNDTSTTKPGEGRLTVRHVAAAPGVDVLAGTDAVITNLENPDEKVLNLPAGTVPASVVATGTTEPALLGPADVAVTEGTNTILYAWGDATADPSTLALATQVIEGLHSDPTAVQAGELGLVAESGSATVWPFALGGLVVLGAAALGFAGRRHAAVTR